MGNLNPMMLLMQLKSGNPQQVVQQIISNNYANDPTMQRLLQMGMSNDVQGLTQYAQQLFSSQGKDFNQEMLNLINTIKNL